MICCKNLLVYLLRTFLLADSVWSESLSIHCKTIYHPKKVIFWIRSWVATISTHYLALDWYNNDRAHFSMIPRKLPETIVVKRFSYKIRQDMQAPFDFIHGLALPNLHTARRHFLTVIILKELILCESANDSIIFAFVWTFISDSLQISVSLVAYLKSKCQQHFPHRARICIWINNISTITSFLHNAYIMNFELTLPLLLSKKTSLMRWQLLFCPISL